MKTYLRHRICNVIDVKELIALEELDFEGKYRNYEESHDFWELCFVSDGGISVQIGNRSFPLYKDQMILISPNKKHSYQSPDGNKSKSFVVCFDSFSQALEAISEYVFSLENNELFCMNMIMAESSSTFRTNESDHLAVLSTPIFGGQQALLLQLEYLLISLVRQISAKKSSEIVFFSDDNFYEELVSAIQRYLRENLIRKITLNDVCDRFNYSRSFICKTFKSQTGESLITCLNRMKTEKAAKLLRETNKSIKDVATDLGFREIKYFDTVFKKRYGVSPAQYRESGKK